MALLHFKIPRNVCQTTKKCIPGCPGLPGWPFLPGGPRGPGLPGDPGCKQPHSAFLLYQQFSKLHLLPSHCLHLHRAVQANRVGREVQVCKHPLLWQISPSPNLILLFMYVHRVIVCIYSENVAWEKTMTDRPGCPGGPGGGRGPGRWTPGSPGGPFCPGRPGAPGLKYHFGAVNAFLLVIQTTIYSMYEDNFKSTEILL